jgi:tetratricopeptide (TPR) repeat protein
VYERALAVARAVGDGVEPTVLASLLTGRAESLVEMGRHADAVADAAEALAIAERAGDDDLAARALLALGRSENDLGRSDEARDLLERARRRFRRAGDERGEAWTLHRLSETWSGVDSRRELDHLRRSYERFVGARDRWGRSAVAQDLAYLLSMNGGEEYRTWYRRSRRLAADEGDLRSRAQVARTAGYVAFHRGNRPLAMRAMDEARPLAASCGDRYAEADAVYIRTLVDSEIGAPAAAEADLQELLRFAAELGSARLRVLALLAGARVSLRSGNPAQAIRRLAAATGVVEEREMRVVGTETDVTRSGLALDRGDFAAVPEPAARVSAAARRAGWDLWTSLGPLYRGRAQFGRGRHARAVAELTRATDIARRTGADGTERLAGLLLAQSSAWLGRPGPRAGAAERASAPGRRAPRRVGRRMALHGLDVLARPRAGAAVLRGRPRRRGRPGRRADAGGARDAADGAHAGRRALGLARPGPLRATRARGRRCPRRVTRARGRRAGP